MHGFLNFILMQTRHCRSLRFKNQKPTSFHARLLENGSTPKQESPLLNAKDSTWDYYVAYHHFAPATLKAAMAMMELVL
jgi:hypothetical protein